MEFVNKFYAIINFNVCISGSSKWWTCARQSLFQVVISLVYLFFEILWYFIYGIVIGILVIIICSTIIYTKRKIKNLNDRLSAQQTQSQSINVLVQGIDKAKVSFSKNNTQPKDSKLSDPSRVGPRPPHIVEQEERQYHEDLTGGVYDYEEETVKVAYKPRRSLPARQFRDDSSDEYSYHIPKSSKTANKSNIRRKSIGGAFASAKKGERKWERENGITGKRTRLTRRLSDTTQELSRSSDESISHVQQPLFSPAQSPNKSNNIDANVSLKDLFSQVLQSTNQPINYPAPPKFNKSMNVADWIRDIDLYIEICNVKDKKKTIFWAYLDEATRKMLNNFTFDDNDDIAVQDLKQKLMELFGRIPLSAHEQMKAFNSCEQDVNENVRVYENRLEGLCRKAFPNCFNYETYIIDQFTNGVLNKKLQHDLLTSKPISITEMLEKATNYEVAYKKQLKQREDANNKSSKPNQTAPLQSSNGTVQKAPGNNTLIGNYNNNHTSINAQASRPPVFNNATRPSYQATTSPNRVSQDVRTCYRCGGTDHLVAKCQQQVSSTTDAAQLTTIPIRHV
jgi:predicted DNA binding CopG/RHH family protein